MNQLKLLNFYKLLSNIATRLIGSFIPLIIYNATGSIALGCGSIILQYVCRIGCNFICSKFYKRQPQLALVVRLVPVIIYSVFILIIEKNVWLGAIGACVFYGINESFNRLPIEIIFNYASLDSSEKSNSLGLSRLLEQVGILMAVVIGGFILDVSVYIVIILSVVIYLISVIPLVIFYVKSRSQKTFNQDAISNAIMTIRKKDNEKSKLHTIVKRFVLGYGLTYFIYCFYDVYTSAFTLNLFLSGSVSYGMAGVFTAIYNASYGVGCYVFGIVDSRKDTTIAVSISAVVCAVGISLLPFVSSNILLYVIMVVTGFLYAWICTFVLQRLLQKSRILGVSNKALVVREQASNTSIIAPFIIGLFGVVKPIMIVAGVAMLLSAFVIPWNEEKSRKNLVDFLQYNEIVRNKSLRRKINERKAENRARAQKKKAEKLNVKKVKKEK